MIKHKHARIGIPRALIYHKYAPMWSHFFRSIGCDLLISPNTNRAILEQGTQYAIDENCLAVKIYLGHVQYLIGKVDYIFIPRIVSLFKGEYMCVKMFALADIVRNTFENTSILEYSVDTSTHEYQLIGMMKMGLQLNNNFVTVAKAYIHARQALAAYNQAQLKKQLTMLSNESASNCHVLLVAHSYITNDALLGKEVIKLLNHHNVEVVYAHIVDENIARRLSAKISTDLYWTHNKDLLGAIEFYKDKVDGIIFLMAFPCGPDALVINFCQNTITDIPISVLVLDELSGDAGLKTRIESFVDILRFKKGGEV